MEVEGGVESWKEEPTARVVEPVAQSGADRSSPGKSKTARLRGCGCGVWVTVNVNYCMSRKGLYYY